jgi:hypothetical protein
MMLPNVSPRIEQGNKIAGVWIKGGKIGSLVLVAEHARKREIELVGQAAMLLGNDVVNLVERKRSPFGHQTVFAALLRPSANETTELGRNVSLTHEALSL